MSPKFVAPPRLKPSALPFRPVPNLVWEEESIIKERTYTVTGFPCQTDANPHCVLMQILSIRSLVRMGAKFSEKLYELIQSGFAGALRVISRQCIHSFVYTGF